VTEPRRVVVVGAGVSGLTTALTVLSDSPIPVSVTVLEAGPSVGGLIRTSPFAGLDAVDEGADAFLVRVPWAAQLAAELGLGAALTAPTGAHAAVWHDGMHPIPGDLLLGVPAKMRSFATSRLVSPRGKLRAALEPLLPRTTPKDSIGHYVRRRFGNEIHERLVDPLVGSIYAADTDHFSLAAVPQIADLAAKHRSVLLAGRRMPAPAPNPGPVFYAPSGGMGRLAAATAEAATALGAVLRIGTAVSSVSPDGDGWRVDDDHHDAVVMACPAGAAAGLLQQSSPDAAASLRAIPAADVAMVTLAVPADAWPERLRGLSGYLVPKPMQRLVTAASFGSQKWSHWQSPGTVVLRVSLGRDGLPVLHLDDEQLLAAAVEEVGHHVGLAVEPTHARVTRWPGAFPQYRPHHARTVDELQQRLPRRLLLAGASYHGIGVPACINSGQKAAAAAVNPS